MNVIRPATIVWFCVVVAVGYAMFQVKYEVMQQEQTLAGINKQITDDREQIRVLAAEWSYLTRPSRIEDLSARFLHLGNMNSAQILPLGAVPERADAGAPPAALPASAAAAATPPHLAAATSRSQP
jgi:hypothetical protein